MLLHTYHTLRHAYTCMIEWGTSIGRSLKDVYYIERSFPCDDSFISKFMWLSYQQSYLQIQKKLHNITTSPSVTIFLFSFLPCIFIYIDKLIRKFTFKQRISQQKYFSLLSFPNRNQWSTANITWTAGCGSNRGDPSSRSAQCTVMPNTLPVKLKL